MDDLNRRDSVAEALWSTFVRTTTPSTGSDTFAGLHEAWLALPAEAKQPWLLRAADELTEEE